MPRSTASPPAASRRFHIDKRAARLLAAERPPGIGHNQPPPDYSSLSDDVLLTTKQVAEWLGVSIQWLEIGRSSGRYGPKHIVLGPRLIRYTVGQVRAYLRERAQHACTAEYRNNSAAVPHVGTRRRTRRRVSR